MSYSHSILRMTGDADIFTDSLRHALVDHFRRRMSGSSTNSAAAASKDDGTTGAASAAVACEQSRESSNSDDNMIRISNRYFEAQVVLESIGGSNDTTTTLTSSSVSSSSDDGIILVFDARETKTATTSSSSSASARFDGLSYHHEMAEKQNQAGDLLRLCVGITVLSDNDDEEENGPSLSSLSPSEEKRKEEEYSRRVLWCLDHGYEYVESCDLSSKGTQTGHDVRDKDGFARIVEAVGSTVWSSALMHTRKSTELKGLYQKDKKEGGVDAEEEEEEAGGGGGSSDGDGDAAQQHPGSSGNTGKSATPIGDRGVEETTTTTDDGDVTTSGTSLSNEEPPKSLLSDPDKALEALLPTSGEGGVGDNDEPSSQDERAFHNLEGLMNEASRIRQASVNGDMTDEERRHRAGDTAMKLMGLLDSFGFEDEGGKEDDEDDSSADG